MCSFAVHPRGARAYTHNILYTALKAFPRSMHVLYCILLKCAHVLQFYADGAVCLISNLIVGASLSSRSGKIYICSISLTNTVEGRLPSRPRGRYHRP